MLLEFKTSNYKSFADEMVFSMTPAPKQKGLDYSIQKEEAGIRTYKGLCSAVVYGPNASGKTNIISAMDTMKSIVLRGNVKNTDRPNPANTASGRLELIPNCTLKEIRPVVFSITFTEKDLFTEKYLHIRYSFKVLLGRFLDADCRRKITEEELCVNEKTVFLRNEPASGNLKVELPASVEPYFNDGIKSVTDTSLKIAESSLNDEELFLSNGFKNIFSQKLASIILDWMAKKFTVICRSDAVMMMRKIDNPKSNAVYIDANLNEAAKVFGVTSKALGIRTSEDGNIAPGWYSVFDFSDGRKPLIPAEIFESYGTVRFINEFPLIINALLNGSVLVMDEFDASIHPMAVMNIINIFHNNEINKKHAQLVFTTHNPVFLSRDLFRRDEIKFVERDETTDHSIHYSLSDFRTADGTRKGEDYMKNYFVSKYGAIKDIDFSSILENIICEQERQKNA